MKEDIVGVVLAYGIILFACVVAGTYAAQTRYEHGSTWPLYVGVTAVCAFMCSGAFLLGLWLFKVLR